MRHSRPLSGARYFSGQAIASNTRLTAQLITPVVTTLSPAVERACWTCIVEAGGLESLTGVFGENFVHDNWHPNF